MSGNSHTSSSENPYEAPAYTPSILTESADEEHLRAFVGFKAEYYLKNWSPLTDDSERNSGLNWAAFLIPGLWLPYRKMYLATVIYYAIMLAVTIANRLLFVSILGNAVDSGLGLSHYGGVAGGGRHTSMAVSTGKASGGGVEIFGKFR